MPGAVIVSQAQQQPLLTRHVPEVTLNGQARLAGRLPAEQSMRLVLVLPHRNQAELDALLKELYDPSSASYRKFLTVEEFTARFGPSQEDYDAVIGFAEANGLSVVGTSRNRMNLEVTGPVANVEAAFHLTMGTYQHPTENRTFFAPDREPTPNLAVQLWHIAGLDNYSTPKPAVVRRDASAALPALVRRDASLLKAEPNAKAKPNATTGTGPSASYLGSDMRAAYYVNGNASATLTGAGQSVGLFEFLGTDLADLTAYYTNAGQTNHVPITLKSVDTQNTICQFQGSPRCDDTEQTLDMTQVLGMAPGLSSLVMYIGTGGLSGQTLDDPGILNAMATASPLNAQLSCAWEWTPSDPTTDDVYFEEFAAQGQNFFAADGDDGNWSHARYVWPADSVYVTAVGGTVLTTIGAGDAWASETGWEDGGGGISPDNFPIPSWQVATAAGCAECSQTYRNGPDVAANADFSYYVCADQEACTSNLYGGTSFSTSLWAGYMALVNEQTALNGNPVLGFINPTLYTIGLSADYDIDFHDITSGGNTLGTTVGYDLSTGWGSPNGSALIDALAGAQNPTFYISSSPTSVAVTQGMSGASTITTTHAGGFNSPIALSATGLPAGVTANFNPASMVAPGSGTSTLTLTVAATTATGMYPITVTGMGGNLTLSTKVTLTVIAVGQAAVPNVVGDTQAAATTAITGAGLTLGTVTTQSSFVVASGNVISESPSAGTVVSSGSAVDIVVSSGSGGAPPPPGSNEWTWMSGSNAVGNAGVYGTLGTPAAGNTPGDRDSASTWTDSGGHLWLFGGEGTDANHNFGFFNELWEFSPATSEWAWVGGSKGVVAGFGMDQPGVYGTLGVPAQGNIPGGRSGATTWTDSSGHFWLLGGDGADTGGNSGLFNDLWEFNPSTGFWTWMSGSGTIGANGGQPGVYGTLGTPAAGNIPGARQYGASWADSKGNLWLFGGNGLDVNGARGFLNDLWEFNPSLGAHGEWAWMGGSSTIGANGGQFGVYGTEGTPAAGNIPGGRKGPVSWADHSGNFWLFGGFGYDANVNTGGFNDLWEFNPAKNQWTWMSGSTTVSVPGVYGTLGVPAAANVPGGRYAAISWTDSSGNFWLFGGDGQDGTDVNGYLNDLWEFGPSTGEWAWMSGSSTVGNFAQFGVYGTLGTAAASNVPGGRENASEWTDSSGNFWLFGGYGADASDNLGYLNDLWSFPPTAPGTIGQNPAATPTFSLPSGTYSNAQIVTISDATAGATIYYTTDGTTPTTSSTIYNGAINVSATETIQAIAVAAGDANSAVASATYTIQVSVPIQVAVPNVVGDTQAAATTAITAAQLVVGTVTTASSPTVASGNVISESPIAGTGVNPGSAVNLVVSTGSGTPQVAVPNVVGDTQAAATTAITAAGLTLGTVTTQSSPNVASGNIISESPIAGTTVNSGSAVNIVVSSGPAQVVVPNVVGDTQAAATTAITAAGLTLGTVTTQSSPNVASGNIISESPIAGTTVNSGSAVNIVVSSGPAQVAVPNVVGDTQAAATTAITAAGLTLGTVTTQSSPNVASGNVISESPIAGASVSSGSAVNLVVSSGPAQVAVPNVVGDTQAAATTAITAAGLTLGTVTTQSSPNVASGNVISESPIAGTNVSSGSAVNLVVSSGPAQVAVPNVVGDTQAAATTAITAAGLTLGTVTTQSSPNVASGNVISELPIAGTNVSSGSAVNLVVSSGPAQVAVPNVVGDTQAAATTAITAAGLTLGTVTTQSSPNVASGNVISELPIAGTNVSSGSAVNLVVSSGPAQVAVPNVVGDTQAAATTAITAAGLTLGTVTTQSSPNVASGNVISESPIAGTNVSSGSAVNLVVSSGPAQVAVPNVVGDTQAAATTAITAAGLTLGTVTTQSSPNVASGNVISETPIAGASVSSGSAVNLVVSSGPAQVAVPNVVGDTQAAATTAITAAGLTLGTVTTQSSPNVASGNVISETPIAGASVSSGSAVNLVVSSGPAQVAVPVISPAAGSFTSAQSVTITDSTAGAVIYYTLNGTTPTASSTLYTGAITVSSTETIEAIAIASGFSNSAVASVDYVIVLGTPGYTLSANPSTLTIMSGSTEATVITLTPTNGFTGTVNFTCGMLPSNVTCGFSPASLTVASGGSAPTTTLTIGTTGTNIASLRDGSGATGPNGTLLPGIFAAIILLPLGFTRRILRTRKKGGPWLMGLLLVATASLAAAGMIGLSGCGGSSEKSTPAGTYSILVNVTSGGTTVPLDLTILVD
jgi:beta-lactam-binding protein with PASTA domain/N-acetylneuraminic acid mutarotase